jgi:hypothetical protein
VNGASVRRVEVSIGLRSESDVEVVDGLEEGQIVLAVSR